MLNYFSEVDFKKSETIKKIRFYPTSILIRINYYYGTHKFQAFSQTYKTWMALFFERKEVNTKDYKNFNPCKICSYASIKEMTVNDMAFRYLNRVSKIVLGSDGT